MRIPKYWAEGRAKNRSRERQITIRRWGWSDDSQEDAQHLADKRADTALRGVLSGEKRPRYERKVPYNGAEGVPIREEIVARHGQTIITRNSYGALCLNTPDVLFADVDFESDAGCLLGCIGPLTLGLLAAAGSVPIARQIEAPAIVPIALLAGALLGVWVAYTAIAVVQRVRGGQERIAESRLNRFLDRNPRWLVRVYRTPAGLRILATHALFDPTSTEPHRFFKAMGGDPVYATMCRRQACFRARVSPKPWRTGFTEKMRPGHVWPVPTDRLDERAAWVNRYEEACSGYAACEFVATRGSGATHPDALEVQRLHDTLSKAESGLPIA